MSRPGSRDAYSLTGFAFTVSRPQLKYPLRRSVIKAIFLDIAPICGLSPRPAARAIGLAP